jgi:ABC-2 type transport system permease protein
VNFVWAVFKREVRSYFVSPLAYTAMAVFLMIMGVLFFAALNAYNQQRLMALRTLAKVTPPESLITSLLGDDAVWALLIIVPLLTMRLLAEERRQHTAELLLTAPMTTRHIVWGKFFGSVFMLMCMLALTAWMPLTLVRLGDADPSRVWSGYIGALLYGALLLSLGLLASSLTESPFLAALIALLLTAVASVAGGLAEMIPVVGSELRQFTPAENLATFASGVIETQAVVFFVTVTAFLLEITAGVVDSQRWR